MTELIPYLIGSGLTGGVLLAYLLFFPEKIEKLAALCWRIIYRAGWLVQFAHKNYVKHDIQAHVNDFVRKKTRQLPGFYGKGVKLQWAGRDISKDAFLHDDQVIVRISRERSDAANIATATYQFVSISLLHRAKRYISPSQGRATDLFVTSQLLREQKPQVVDYFLETFLHPGLDDKHKKALDVFRHLECIDSVGLFFPVYIRELDFLGRKVFGTPKNDVIVKEVRELIEFLKQFSKRKVGEEGDLNFLKTYCKFGLMIIGRAQVVTASIEPYLTYVRQRVQPANTETLYVIGPEKHVEAIRRVIAEVRDIYECIATHKYSTILKRDDQEKKVRSYLAVLRAVNRPIVTEV